MKININTTKIMVSSKNKELETIQIEEETLEQIGIFIYLGELFHKMKD